MKIRITVSVLILLFMTSCFNLSIDIDLSRDSADITQSIYISKSMMDIDEMKIREELDDKSVEISENDEFIILNKHITIASDDFANRGITLDYDNGGYNVILNPFIIMDADNDMAMLMQETFSMAVHINDGRIDEHNGDSIINNTVYFTIPFNTNESYAMPSIHTYTGINIRLYVIILASILAVFIVIIILVFKGKK